MKVDFSKALVDLKGDELKTDEGTLTLERVAVSALLQPAKDETGESKYKKYGLIKQIHGTTEPVDMKSEDIASIKRAIGDSSFTAMVTGQAWDLLEGK